MHESQLPGWHPAGSGVISMCGPRTHPRHLVLGKTGQRSFVSRSQNYHGWMATPRKYELITQEHIHRITLGKNRVKNELCRAILRDSLVRHSVQNAMQELPEPVLGEALDSSMVRTTMGCSSFESTAAGVVVSRPSGPTWIGGRLP